MSFLYYLPGRTSVSAKELEELGLAYAFKNLGQKHLRPVKQNGPDKLVAGGGAGLIVACKSRVDGKHVGYYPDRQTWKHYPAKNLWVGLPHGPLPGPEDLAHNPQLPGEFVTLADDRQWLVPYARRWSAVDDEVAWLNVLPRTMDMGDDGHLMIGGPIPKYAALWSIAEADRSVRTGKATEELLAAWTVEMVVLHAVQVLQANYALGLVEAVMLGLFTQENWARVFDALNGRNELEHLLSQKKSPADPSDSDSSCSGREDTSPNIDQP